ncbi:hypothetical protein [Mammaliicoccus sciuri]|uniref:hypothetical protein n=1 Tax=Mammaliicoccus sciuri TaxID=1296 RepID=UPI00265C3953|nr:hypothetical protein [Mammaliicoccus sciuri]MDO0948203.1 hypothetical protein [Mammaliicoccus sciuri]MDO0953426.1 hypothetical protein [Mammaliicoccus sciuri]
MAYEYKEEIENHIICAPVHVDDELFDELEEVYAKAKAWDNYLADVENSIREITDNEDEVKWHVDYSINEYMEDK